MSTWMEDLLALTEIAESPRSFFYWAGLATISAVVKNKVYVKKKIYRLYPNVYILFVAPSGLRKGWPVSVSKQLMTAVDNTRIISGRSSIQAIVQELSKPKRTKSGELITDAAAYINSGEFSTSLVRDMDALTILTDLYDGMYNPEWKNTLKSTGSETLKNVNLTLLGALNPTHFDDMITEKEVSGGFIGRCIVQYEEKRSRKNSLISGEADDLEADEEPEVDLTTLVPHLRELTKIEGKMLLTKEAKQIYNQWFYSWEPEMMEDKTGTANRINDTILKVAILVSLSKRLTRVIDGQDMEEALDKCLITSSTIKRITGGKGKAKFALQQKMVIEDLFKAPNYSLTHEELLRKHWGDFDTNDLSQIAENLFNGKAIMQRRNGTQWTYTLTEKFLTAYQEAYKKEEN